MARKSETSRVDRTLGRTLDAQADTVDFRDRMFVPTLVEVRPESNLEAYRALGVPVLNQGKEGACTGFGLATVANYLVRNLYPPDRFTAVSARMLYVLARRYDEWPGEEYSGSSPRGAMKGWHKHGVCAEKLWADDRRDDLDSDRAADALDRPLGAYFRVNHKDLVAMHSAISQVGVLYAAAGVHAGWRNVGADGIIKTARERLGGHAFAIVGYDRDGFWLQNSWGEGWGAGGLARLSYDDWLEYGADVWVARLGAPVKLKEADASAAMRAGAPRSYESYVYSDLRPHIVTCENDGLLRAKGTYGLTREGLKTIITEEMPKRMAQWGRKRVLLYAHGGLIGQDSAIQYAANRRETALKSQIYPISFIWRSDAWTTIGNILSEAFRSRRPEGVLDVAEDFMLDRLDDTLEPLAGHLGGKAMWNEMKENATGATTRAAGAAALAAGHLAKLFQDGAIDEIHLAGHSAGAVFMGPLAQLLGTQGKIKDGPMKGKEGYGLPIESLSLWAPACNMKLYDSAYRPLLEAGRIERFGLYTLSKQMEEDDDCRGIYHKSLLFLVSGAFEARTHLPMFRQGEPLLGMTRDVEQRADMIKLFTEAPGRHVWVTAPDDVQSNARHHGDFDNDALTLQSSLSRILGGGAAESAVAAPSHAVRAGLVPQQQRRAQLAQVLAAVDR